MTRGSLRPHGRKEIGGGARPGLANAREFRAPPASQPEPSMLALEAIGVTKRYGGLVALSDGRLELRAGEVHVLMGSNGCGKSTLCKVVAGAVEPDGGEVRLLGAPVAFRNPHQAKSAGIATVYQEMSLVSTLNVAENVLLGAEPSIARAFVDRAARLSRVRALIASVGKLGEGLDPDDLVGDLPVDK